jgi:hypothetical protein
MNINLRSILFIIGLVINTATCWSQIAITPPPISPTAVVTKITGATAWSAIQSNNEYLYAGAGETVAWVDGTRDNVTIHNAGTGVLSIWDTGENHSLDLPPGESVLFSTYEESPGLWQFYESTRKAISASSITEGTLSGDRMQTAGPGNSGAISTGAQTIAGPKTFTGTLTATSGTFGTVRAGSAITTSATTGTMQAATSVVGSGTYGSLRITGATTMALSGSTSQGARLFVAADQLAGPNYVTSGEFSAGFSGSTSRIYGLQSYATMLGTGSASDAFGSSAIVNTHNSASIANAYASENSVRLVSGGTMTQAIGTRSYVGAYSAASTGAISTAIGVRADIQKQSSPATINAGYGVYIGDIEANADYGLYSAGADDDNVFAGNLAVYGNTSLGDASGDALLINSSNPTAPNVSSMNGPSSIPNRQAGDDRWTQSAVGIPTVSISCQNMSTATQVSTTGTSALPFWAWPSFALPDDGAAYESQIVVPPQWPSTSVAYSVLYMRIGGTANNPSIIATAQIFSTNVNGTSPGIGDIISGTTPQNATTANFSGTGKGWVIVTGTLFNIPTITNSTNARTLRIRTLRGHSNDTLDGEALFLNSVRIWQP